MAVMNEPAAPKTLQKSRILCVIAGEAKQSHLLSLFIKPQVRVLRSLYSLAMTEFRNDGILDGILNEIASLRSQ